MLFSRFITLSGQKGGSIILRKKDIASVFTSPDEADCIFVRLYDKNVPISLHFPSRELRDEALKKVRKQL